MKGRVINVMNTTVKVISVRVYGNEDAVRYRADINQEIDGIIIKDGEYVEAKIKHLDFHPSVFIAQCLNHIAGLDILYNKKKEAGLRSGNGNGFGAAELQTVLRDAEVVIKRTKFESGDEYELSDGTISTHEFAGYSTEIVSVKVSDKVQSLLDRMIDKMFEI